MYHNVTIFGNLGRDPEMRYTSNGTAVTSFSVAVNEGYGDNKEVVWFNVSVWGNRAESCNEYLVSGQQVLIEGKLKPDKGTGAPRVFERKDGTTGASYDLWANNVIFGKKSVPERNATSEQEIRF